MKVLLQPYINNTETDEFGFQFLVQLAGLVEGNDVYIVTSNVEK